MSTYILLDINIIHSLVSSCKFHLFLKFNKSCLNTQQGLWGPNNKLTCAHPVQMGSACYVVSHHSDNSRKGDDKQPVNTSILASASNQGNASWNKKEIQFRFIILVKILKYLGTFMYRGRVETVTITSQSNLAHKIQLTMHIPCSPAIPSPLHWKPGCTLRSLSGQIGRGTHRRFKDITTLISFGKRKNEIQSKYSNIRFDKV